ncbi:carboxylesterase/lipase family protein [Parvularcula marina]|uniref:carboxylesterase/lipase family protein n=1 Tax=Parvularcula marina TaxID=2292771 RepID=UPI0035115732
MHKSFQSLICLCAVLLSGCADAGDDHVADDNPVVSAPAGKVKGVAQDGINIFKGIPYAEAPVGELRWKPTVRLAAWDGVRDAQEFGPACIQPQLKNASSESVYAYDIGEISEDCLTLNIWAPEDAKDAPVFFWIHGGALRAGSGKEPLYEGTKFAEQGVIVVSVNYRLGVLGFYSHPELSAESPDGSSGNYGLLDQIAALEWVKDNISAFGGDPEQVTIAGESAGALSVMYLMTSPKAEGLFDGAIAQSAYMVTTPALAEMKHGVPSAEDVGLATAKAMGVENIADLRAMDAQEVYEQANKVRFAPFGVVDGVIIPDQPVAVFERGEQAPVPLLVGFNSGEVRSMRALAPAAPDSAEAYEDVIRARYGDLADEFLRLYPSETLEDSIVAATRDALYGWTSERMAKNQTALGQSAYLYMFDHGYPAADERGLHGFHASELPYVFGTLDLTPMNWPKIPDTDAEKEFSAAMTSYWANFAKTGTPSAPGAAEWASFNEDEAYMAFEDQPRADHHLMPGMYELHEETVCRRRASGSLPWNWNTGLWSPVLPSETADCP